MEKRCIAVAAVVSIAWLGLAAQAKVPATSAAVRAAKEYIEDRLKDPLSAHYTHLEVSRIGVLHHNALNVCGYVYSKNGYGVYDGRSQFVVSIKNNRATDLFWDIDNNREVSATFAFFGERVCASSMIELKSYSGTILEGEIIADGRAHLTEDECLSEFRNSSRDHPSDTIRLLQVQQSCLSAAQAVQRSVYSRLLGIDYYGVMGVH